MYIALRIYGEACVYFHYNNGPGVAFMCGWKQTPWLQPHNHISYIYLISIETKVETTYVFSAQDLDIQIYQNEHMKWHNESIFISEPALLQNICKLDTRAYVSIDCRWLVSKQTYDTNWKYKKWLYINRQSCTVVFSSRTLDAKCLRWTF